MFVSDCFVFLELQKTGCSHIVKLFEDYASGRQMGKHDMLRSEDKHKKVIGSVRNPWDWYVSLWSYGCSMRGGMYTRTIKKAQLNHYLKPFDYGRIEFGNSFIWFYDFLFKKTEDWKQVYSDVNNPELFQKWIKMVLDPSTSRHFGEGYFFHPTSKFIGLLSWRYCRLFVNRFLDPGIFSKLRSDVDFRKYEEENQILFDIIKNESLETDFIRILNRLNVRVTSEDEKNIMQQKKTNTSKHLSSEYYHNQETLEIIGIKEKFIIDKYYSAHSDLGLSKRKGE